MTVPATVPPRAFAFIGVQPCAAGNVSCSSRRKARVRKVAVRHSILQTTELKLNLTYSGYSDASTGDLDTKSLDDGAVPDYRYSSALCPEAQEFIPPCFTEVGSSTIPVLLIESSCEVDNESIIFDLKETTYNHIGSLPHLRHARGDYYASPASQRFSRFPRQYQRRFSFGFRVILICQCQQEQL